jgi:hypothetical protein
MKNKVWLLGFLGIVGIAGVNLDIKPLLVFFLFFLFFLIIRKEGGAEMSSAVQCWGCWAFVAGMIVETMLYFFADTKVPGAFALRPYDGLLLLFITAQSLCFVFSVAVFVIGSFVAILCGKKKNTNNGENV